MLYVYDSKGELVSMSIDGTPLDISRRVATNADKTEILWEWESKPFGETKASGDITFNLRFPGQYFDNETKTHYNITQPDKSFIMDEDRLDYTWWSFESTDIFNATKLFIHEFSHWVEAYFYGEAQEIPGFYDNSAYVEFLATRSCQP